MTDVERIAAIIRDFQLTNSQFAQRTGISPSTLSNVLSGKTRPTLPIIMSISDNFPQISLTWLLKGDGEMYNQAAGSEAGVGEEGFPGFLSFDESNLDSGISNPDLGGFMQALDGVAGPNGGQDSSQNQSGSLDGNDRTLPSYGEGDASSSHVHAGSASVRHSAPSSQGGSLPAQGASLFPQDAAVSTLEVSSASLGTSASPQGGSPSSQGAQLSSSGVAYATKAGRQAPPVAGASFSSSAAAGASGREHGRNGVSGYSPREARVNGAADWNDGNARYGRAQQSERPALSASDIVRETMMQMKRPTRKVVEVHIYYDDGTYEVFGSGK